MSKTPPLDPGVLEPIAAGSARVWKDDLRSLSRQLVFVLDVGAGTTDLSLFWVVQDPARRRALPVKPAARAVRAMANCRIERTLRLASFAIVSPIWLGVKHHTPRVGQLDVAHGV